MVRTDFQPGASQNAADDSSTLFHSQLAQTNVIPVTMMSLELYYVTSVILVSGWHQMEAVKVRLSSCVLVINLFVSCIRWMQQLYQLFDHVQYLRHYARMLLIKSVLTANVATENSSWFWICDLRISSMLIISQWFQLVRMVTVFNVTTIPESVKHVSRTMVWACMMEFAMVITFLIFNLYFVLVFKCYSLF